MESTGSDVEGNAAFEAIQSLLLDDPPEGMPESILVMFMMFYLQLLPKT